MKHLLMDARAEILQLRHDNEILRAKVDTMELFALVFRTQPNYGSQGMSEDIAWKLAKAIAAEEAKTP